MTTPVFTNNLETTLAVTTTEIATTIEVADASIFNTLIQDGAGATNGVHEMATLTDGTNIEVVKVTDADTGTNIITVAREQEGTTGYAFLSGDVVEGRLTAGELNGKLLNIIPLGANILGTDALDLVIGDRTTGATGYRSVALGANAESTGAEAVAIGHSCEAHGDSSVSIGRNCQVDELGGLAIGYQCTASKSGGLAIGNQSATFQAIDSIAIGTAARCHGEFGGVIDNQIAIGHNATCGLASYGNKGIAIGYNAYVSGQYSMSIGTNSNVNRISNSHILSGLSMIAKDNGETAELLNFTAQENITFSQEYDFTLALADNVITIEIPTASTFFVSEVGFIPTSLNTITSNPTIEFGVNTTTDALMTATLTTTQTVKKRERYNEVLNSTNWVADAELVGATVQLTVSVTVAAVATTFLGRVYFKGMLVEDE